MIHNAILANNVPHSTMKVYIRASRQGTQGFMNSYAAVLLVYQ